MTPSQVLEHYKTHAEIARVLGCRQSSVAEMFEKDQVPEGRQYQIELATRGKLRAELPADRRTPAQRKRFNDSLKQHAARQLMAREECPA
jgi:hypothetical protein